MRYDIYRQASNRTPMWIESASDCGEARTRIAKLALKYRAIYLIYDGQSVIERVDKR